MIDEVKRMRRLRWMRRASERKRQEKTGAGRVGCLGCGRGVPLIEIKASELLLG